MKDSNINPYAEEARQKWGHTEAYQQSQERVKKMEKQGLKKVIEEGKKLTEEMASQMLSGYDAKDVAVQRLIAKHYESLRTFYEPNLELYKGLAKLYVEDERFKANYEKVAKGLAQFMHDAMMCFVDTKKVD